MMRKFHTCVLLAAVLFTACKKDDDIDPVVPYQPIPAQSEMGNFQNGSYVTSDKDNIYFSHLDTEGIKLYAKNRETAKLTVLDVITTPSVVRGNILFTNLYIHGGYLYYSPLDFNGNRRNTIWRAKTDGSAKEEVVADQTSSVIYYKDKIYYQSEGLFSVNMDGSGRVKLLDQADRMAINDDKLYYMTYEFEEFTTHLNCCALDGTSPKQLAQYKGYITFTFGSGKIYAMLGSGNTFSLIEMNTDGSGQKEILSSLPYAMINSFGNTLFLVVSEGNNSYSAGFYKYQQGYKILMPLLSDLCSFFYFTGDNEIVYGNDNYHLGDYPLFYQTDFTGKKSVKLLN